MAKMAYEVVRIPEQDTVIIRVLADRRQVMDLPFDSDGAEALGELLVESAQTVREARS